jgi:hypothetical protein
MPAKNPLPRLREIRDIQKSASELTSERDRLIRKAVKMEIPERRIAKAAGLSSGRVHQIALSD